MEWLTRLWEKLLRDIVLTMSGLIVVGTQVAAARPNVALIGAGLALTTPSAYANLRKVVGGSPAPPSPPPGPAPSTPPPAPGERDAQT